MEVFRQSDVSDDRLLMQYLPEYSDGAIGKDSHLSC